jgi:hypothetical protein
VKDAIAVLPGGADFKPFAMPLAFPTEGKGGMRRCFIVGHANQLSRFHVREKMNFLRMMEILIGPVVAGRVVMPRVHPIQRVRKERDGGMCCFRQ